LLHFVHADVAMIDAVIKRLLTDTTVCLQPCVIGYLF